MTPRTPRAGEDADDLDVEEALALVNDAHTPGDRPSGDRTHGDDGAGGSGSHGSGSHGASASGAPARPPRKPPAGAAATAADTFRPSRSRCPPRSASPWPPR